MYDIDLDNYQGVTSVKVENEGIFMALFPEGASFEATSYDFDGTVRARFDESGNSELYAYDFAGRVVRVEDAYGNLLREYEYNRIINE